MNSAYNATLLGKLFDRAADPASAENDVRLALRKAHQICQAANKMPSDAILVEEGLFVDACLLQEKDLFDRIAELEIALFESEDRELALAAAHLVERDSQRSRSVDREAALRAEIADRDARIGERDIQITDLEAQIAELKVVNDARLTVETVAAWKTRAPTHDDESSVIADQPELARVEPKPWKRSDWKAFERLAIAGCSKLKMARELTRVLGRSVTAACVGELMRLRWSATSGRRFAMWNAS